MLDYTNTLRRHVLPTLGDVELAVLEARGPEPLDAYIATKRREKARAEDDRQPLAHAFGAVRVCEAAAGG